MISEIRTPPEGVRRLPSGGKRRRISEIPIFMILIVGLGNTGKKYEHTRHNAGFIVIDELGKQNLDSFILAKTDTFMNLSGQAVKKITKNYKLKTKNLVVVHDDIDLPLGEFKIQKGRGAAGHKGVQSVIDELKTKDFWRIRIGICPKRGKPENVEKFVLQNFSKEEGDILKKVIKKVIQGLVDFRSQQRL